MSSEPNQPPKRAGTRSYRNLTPLDPSPAIPAIPADADAYRSHPLVPPAQPSEVHVPQPDFSHTQLRLRQPKQSASEKTADKFEAMEELLKIAPFDNLGDFLAILFHNPIRGKPNPRGTTHTHVVAQFLRGRTTIKMSDILPLMYHHKASFPTSKSVNVHEQNQMFSTSGPVDESNHARPFISTWATRLVAAEARKQIGRATRDDPEDPEARVQLRATSNGRRAAHVVTWKELLQNTKYSIRLPLPWFLTEYMSAPKSKGAFFVRKRRPHPIVSVSLLHEALMCAHLSLFRFKSELLLRSSFPEIATPMVIWPWLSVSGTSHASRIST